MQHAVGLKIKFYFKMLIFLSRLRTVSLRSDSQKFGTMHYSNLSRKANFYNAIWMKLRRLFLPDVTSKYGKFH